MPAKREKGLGVLFQEKRESTDTRHVRRFYNPDEDTEPLLTVLNYSGGRQSSCILWMVLLGELKVPEHFVVMNADPGMENSETYRYNELMFEECEKAGITAITAEGPDLYQDLVGLGESGMTRIDNPPYWTKDAQGKQGKLMQKCTRHYKVAPMDRAIRIVMEEKFGIGRRSSHLAPGIVEKWIGFAWDEIFRLKDPMQKYIRFRYPLIDMRWTREDVRVFFEKRDLPMPPRSMCSACFANGLDTYRTMRAERPADWGKALAVDRAVRDLTQIGIHEEVFVSKTLVPLKELAERGFSVGDERRDQDGWSCDSGYCFT